MGGKSISDVDLAAIERRNTARLEFRKHMTSGTWEYDALGFVDTVDQPKARRMGALVRRREWFDQIEMDAKMTRADQQAAWYGQYIAAVCTDRPEDDIARLLAEIQPLRAAR